MYKKLIYIYCFMIIILILIGNIAIFQNSNIITSANPEFTPSKFHYNPNSKYSWPLFGYYSISSYFGKRTSPTTGASSNHSGIDIPAPPGTNIYSITSRKSYIYWILWCRRIYNNNRKSKFTNNLCSYFS